MTKEQTTQLHQKIADYVGRHTELTFSEISERTGISVPHISTIARRYGIERGTSANRFRVTEDLLAELDN